MYVSTSYNPSLVCLLLPAWALARRLLLRRLLRANLFTFLLLNRRGCVLENVVAARAEDDEEDADHVLGSARVALVNKTRADDEQTAQRVDDGKRQGVERVDGSERADVGGVIGNTIGNHHADELRGLGLEWCLAGQAGECVGEAVGATGSEPRRQQEEEGTAGRPRLDLQRVDDLPEDGEGAPRDRVDSDEAAGRDDSESKACLLELRVATGGEAEAEANREERGIGGRAVALAEADVDCAGSAAAAAVRADRCAGAGEKGGAPAGGWLGQVQRARSVCSMACAPMTTVTSGWQARIVWTSESLT